LVFLLFAVAEVVGETVAEVVTEVVGETVAEVVTEVVGETVEEVVGETPTTLFTIETITIKDADHEGSNQRTRPNTP
jgi:hypothetical protein